MRFLYNTTTSSSASTTTAIVFLFVSLYLLGSVLFQQYGSSISIKHGGSSSNSFVVEATNHHHQHQHRQLLRTRILEEAEDEDDDEGNDNDNDNDNEDEEEEEDGDSASEEEENDASNYFGYDTSTGYLLATQCRAYKVEEPDDNLNTILEWNTEYGNGLDFFRVPQQSFVYYSYINGNQQDQSSSNGDITHYMIDLTDWIATTAISGLGKDSVPSCQQINDVTGIFHTNDSDDITHYFAITNNNNDGNDEDNADRRLEENEEEEDGEDGDDNAMDFGDWEPQLYVGPICGMTDGTINIGVFIDDTCTTYVPQWTYRYRNALAQGKIKATATTTSTTDSDSSSSDSDSSSSGSYTNADLATLGTLDKYTTKQNHHHWKCNSGDGVLCSSLLSYSADTMYCQSSDNDSNDNNDEEEQEGEEEEEEEEEEEGEEEGEGEEEEEEDEDDQRRKLEEDADEEEDDNEDGDGDDEDDENNNNYQISQEELESMETTCEAVFTSFVYQGQGTLEDYLKQNKQLSKTTNYKKQNKMIVELVVLIVVAFVVFTMTILCQKQRNRRRNNKLQQEGDSRIRRRLFGQNSRRTRKSSASNSATTNTNEDAATVGEHSIKTYNTSSNSSSSRKGSNKKQGRRWFSGFRFKKQKKKQNLLGTF